LANEEIAKFATELPKIRILVRDDAQGCTVKLDGIELREASLGGTLPVDPGEHAILIALPTGESKETRVHLDLGETLSIPLSPPEVARITKPRQPSTVDSRDAARPVRVPSPRLGAGVVVGSSNAERTTAYVASALGVLGVLSSGLFGAFALNEKGVVRQHCPDHVCIDQAGLDAARAGGHDETIANVAFAAGAAALSAGTVLWWHSGKTRVAMSVEPSGALVSYGGILP
jgi:hypothetical protein